MTTDYRAELQRLVKAYDDHGGRWPENDVEALHQAVERARAFLAQPEPEYPSNYSMDNNDAKDAARYRWIKAQKNLAIRTNKIQGVPWTKVDTGERYYPSHQLDVNGTGFNGVEHFDDLIDQAMEMYPFETQ